MRDIVCPNGNEKEMITMAETLGVTHLTLAYLVKTIKQQLKTIELLQSITKVQLTLATIVTNRDLQKKKQTEEKIAFSTGDDGKDRQLFEHKNVTIITDLEKRSKQDALHHRRSGLNQVLCRIAAQKKKIIAFSFNTLLSANQLERATLFGRMKQNKKLCKKFKVANEMFSFAKTPYEMRSRYELDAVMRLL